MPGSTTNAAFSEYIYFDGKRAARRDYQSNVFSSTPSPVPYANLTNPQTLNLYAMVSDNPESFADLDGHEEQIAQTNNACGGPGSANCTQNADARTGALRKTRTLRTMSLSSTMQTVQRPRLRAARAPQRILRATSRLQAIRRQRCTHLMLMGTSSRRLASRVLKPRHSIPQESRQAIP